MAIAKTAYDVLAEIQDRKVAGRLIRHPARVGAG
jgi:hypothetical protein